MIVPYTSMFTWALPPMWRPGERLFTSHERDAQPDRSPISASGGDYPAEATGYFATDMEIEYHSPAIVGDRLGILQGGLVEVSLKETSVGRGAFLKNESSIVDEHGAALATMRTGMYVYEPLPSRPCGPRPASGTSWQTVGPGQVTVTLPR
ncbi:hypothetical protein AB0K60_13755 [Thermopolyspora sp. NPDC052614]|uniref:hypothetical protein n=1 Tax=Thermopolyspora sp. NPDC052614 TaxID=3155682 RepID=UPI00341276AC